MAFHNSDFYLATLTAISRHCTFLCNRLIDPYIRGFVRYYYHSNHRYFIDLRPVGDTIHLWTAFVMLYFTAMLRSLSADFTELLTVSVSAYTASRSIKGSVSRRYPVIPLLGLSVLLFFSFIASIKHFYGTYDHS